jgi:hypothetical protein
MVSEDTLKTVAERLNPFFTYDVVGWGECSDEDLYVAIEPEERDVVDSVVDLCDDIELHDYQPDDTTLVFFDYTGDEIEPEHVWKNGSIVVEHVEDDVYDLNQWRVNRKELHEAETILGTYDTYDATKVTCTFSGVDYKRTRDTEVVIGGDTFMSYEEFDNLVDAVWEHYDEHVKDD